MGYGVIISTALIITVLLQMYIIAQENLLYIGEDFSKTLKEMGSLEESRIKSSCRFQNITLQTDNKTINAILTNNGQFKIGEFDKTDFFITYYNNSVTSHTRLSYCLAGGTDCWTITTISPDIVNPDILDPGENATIEIVLSSAIDGNYCLWDRLKFINKEGAFCQNSFSNCSYTETTTESTTYYLHNNPTPPSGDTNAQTALPLDTTAPTQATLYNYDQERDSDDGVMIAKGGSGPGESTATLVQTWRTSALTSDLTIDGTVTFNIWSGIKSFTTGKKGRINIYLRHYDGSGYTEICNTDFTDNTWQDGTGDWIEKEITFSCSSYTIDASDYLEIELVVHNSAGDDMWFAYDTTSYNSKIVLPS